MARPTLNLSIVLENIHCYDEGDGIGNAEPYLWPVFFKIDGDNYAVETGTGLIGFPVIVSKNGHHENLNNTDVDEGDNVPVPESLGAWNSTLKPIPINDPFIRGLIGDDLPGIAGVIVVLMEQDGWPDDLADTGYDALVNAVTLAVAKVAAGFQHAASAPTKEEIDAAIKTVKDTAATMVRDAIKGAMSGWQLIWYGTFGNNDDTIGSEVWTFTHDDFAADAVIDFSRHWGSDEAGDGDWEISGSATGIAPCPANAFADIFGGTDSATTLSLLRNFRSKEYAALPGLHSWWTELHKLSPDLVRLMLRNRNVRTAAKRLFKAIPGVLSSPDKPLSAEHLEDIQSIINALAKKKSRNSSLFVQQALSLLPKLKDKPWEAAIQIVAKSKLQSEKEEKKSGGNKNTTR